MKHWDKSERLYKLWGEAEGALMAVEEMLVDASPHASKVAGELHRQMSAFMDQMIDKRLGFVVKEYPENDKQKLIETREQVIQG